MYRGLFSEIEMLLMEVEKDVHNGKTDQEYKKAVESYNYNENEL